MLILFLGVVFFLYFLVPVLILVLILILVLSLRIYLSFFLGRKGRGALDNISDLVN